MVRAAMRCGAKPVGGSAVPVARSRPTRHKACTGVTLPTMWPSACGPCAAWSLAVARRKWRCAPPPWARWAGPWAGHLAGQLDRRSRLGACALVGPEGPRQAALGPALVAGGRVCLCGAVGGQAFGRLEWQPGRPTDPDCRLVHGQHALAAQGVRLGLPRNINPAPGRQF